MTELTDEEAKALLAECDNPDCLTCEYARALLDARAEHAASLIRINAEAVEAVAQARADAQAAVALALEEAAENKEQLEIWAHEILVGLAFADVLKIDSYNDKIEAHDMVGRGLVEVIRALAPADGLAAVEALRERAEKAEQERDAAVRGRNDWRDDFKALAAAIVGDTGLSAMTVAAQARTFRPRAEKAEADRDRLAAELAQARADTDAAVALVVERAATEVSLNAWRHEGEDAYSKGMDAGARHQAQVIYNAIRALTPVDGLAMVQELRAEMDTLAAENASLKAAKAVAG